MTSSTCTPPPLGPPPLEGKFPRYCMFASFADENCMIDPDSMHACPRQGSRVVG